MPSAIRILSPQRNALLDATIVATAVRSSDYVRRTSVSRSGGGTVELSGDYTGADDATFDVEIQGAGTTVRASLPVFAGAGNGTMDAPTITPGTHTQTYTFTLVDLGTDTARAKTVFLGRELSARMDGSAGNDITLTVDRSGLTYTATDYSTLEDLPKGANGLTGGQWDFGGRQITPDGEIATGTARLAFMTPTGLDPQIYRQYRAWESGEWIFYLDPAPVRAIPAESQVETVTGTLTLTVAMNPQARADSTAYAEGDTIKLAVDNGAWYLCTDGGTSDSSPPSFSTTRGDDVTDGTVTWRCMGPHTETLSSITSEYDALQAIRQSSQLVEVAGVIEPDRTPGGIAVSDLMVWTDSYALPRLLDGSDHLQDFSTLTVAAAAPTEVLRFTCADNTTVGRELWDVQGTISGPLPAQATTGITYSGGPITAARIPQALPDDDNDLGEIYLSAINYASRAEGEVEPPICMDRLYLGAQAKDQTLTFTYTRRPEVADCVCEDQSITGQPSEACLGIEIEEDATVTATTDPGYLGRVEDWAAWHSTFVGANTEMGSDGELRSANIDLDLAALADTAVRSLLTDIWGTPGTLSWDAWTADTEMSLYDIVEPTTSNGYRYRATALSGDHKTAAVTEPTWPTTIGNTVVDDAVTWTCISETTEGAVDTFIDDVETDLTPIDAIGTAGVYVPSAWNISTAYSVGDDVSNNGAGGLRWYRCVGAGTSGSTSAAIDYQTTTGEIFTEGTVYWEDMGTIRTDTNDDVNSDTARASDAGISRSKEEYARRWTAAANYVRAIAGLDPKAEAGTPGGQCWQDNGDEYWWQVSGGRLLPAFTNVYWISSRRRYDQDAKRWIIESTQEAGLVIKVRDECIAHLVEGDQVVVICDGTGNAIKTYLVGDIIDVPVIHGEDIAPEGGVTGDDTHTWTVEADRDGRFSDYAVVDGAEVAYSDGGISTTIYRGGVANAIGDNWTFDVEGQQARWRKNGGSWSSAADITDSGIAMSDGLTATFTAGSSPNWIEDDLHSFEALQPFSPSHLLAGDEDQWQWGSGSSYTVTLTLAATSSIDTVGIARHSLPDGATALIEGSDNNGSTWDFSQALTLRSGPMVVALDTPWPGITDIRISGTSAANGAIGYAWAGLAWQPADQASQVRPVRRYLMSGATGSTRLTRGKGNGLALAWDSLGASYAADVDELDALLDATLGDDDHPVIVMPHEDYPARAMLGQVSGDALQLGDWNEWQRDDGALCIAVSLGLDPVFE